MLVALLADSYPPGSLHRTVWTKIAEATSGNQGLFDSLWPLGESHPEDEFLWRCLRNLAPSRDINDPRNKIISQRIKESLDARMDRWLREDLKDRPFRLDILEGIFERAEEAWGTAMNLSDYQAARRAVEMEMQAMALASKFSYPKQSPPSALAGFRSGFLNDAPSADTNLKHIYGTFTEAWAKTLWASGDIEGAVSLLKEEAEKTRKSIASRRELDAIVEQSRMLDAALRGASFVPPLKNRAQGPDGADFGLFSILFQLWLISWTLHDAAGDEYWLQAIQYDCPKITESISWRFMIEWLQSSSSKCSTRARVRVPVPFMRVKPEGRSSFAVCLHCAVKCYPDAPKHYDGYAIHSPDLLRQCMCNLCMHAAY